MAKGVKREKAPEGKWDKSYCTYRHFKRRLKERFGVDISLIEYTALSARRGIWNSSPPERLGVAETNEKTNIARWEVRLAGVDTVVFLIYQKKKGLKTCYTQKMATEAFPELMLKWAIKMAVKEMEQEMYGEAPNR